MQSFFGHFLVIEFFNSHSRLHSLTYCTVPLASGVGSVAADGGSSALSAANSLPVSSPGWLAIGATLSPIVALPPDGYDEDYDDPVYAFLTGAFTSMGILGNNSSSNLDPNLAFALSMTAGAKGALIGDVFDELESITANGFEVGEDAFNHVIDGHTLGGIDSARITVFSSEMRRM